MFLRTREMQFWKHQPKFFAHSPKIFENYWNFSKDSWKCKKISLLNVTQLASHYRFAKRREEKKSKIHTPKANRLMPKNHHLAGLKYRSIENRIRSQSKNLRAKKSNRDKKGIKNRMDKKVYMKVFLAVSNYFISDLGMNGLRLSKSFFLIDWNQRFCSSLKVKLSTLETKHNYRFHRSKIGKVYINLEWKE